MQRWAEKQYGLEVRNDRGKRLIQFCQEEEFVITNTWYSLPNRRLYTWTSPQHTQNNIVRNQIDYILINRRFRSSNKSTKTYPGDVHSDHNLTQKDETTNEDFTNTTTCTKGHRNH